MFGGSGDDWRLPEATGDSLKWLRVVGLNGGGWR
jgi:hypothetical protein